MAIDTRNKRASCLGLGLDSLRLRPNPDGTLDASDRLHLSWLYAGIAAASATFGELERVYAPLYILRKPNIVGSVTRTERLPAHVTRRANVTVWR